MVGKMLGVEKLLYLKFIITKVDSMQNPVPLSLQIYMRSWTSLHVSVHCIFSPCVNILQWGKRHMQSDNIVWLC